MALTRRHAMNARGLTLVRFVAAAIGQPQGRFPYLAIAVPGDAARRN